jgi:hypothetical protein
MALEDAPVVNMLNFDEQEAYNHDRPISSLIRTQLLHLHTAENLWLPPEDRTNININHLHTEKQASEYIQKVTALLHRHGGRYKKAESGKSVRKPPKLAKRRKKAVSTLRKKTSRSRSSAKKRGSRR